MTYQDDTEKWPSFAEELGRKGLTALQKYVELYEKGKLTIRELYIVTDVLFDTMSGLADWSACDLIAQINEDIRQDVRRRARQKVQ